jgi:hypothetical protein
MALIRLALGELRRRVVCPHACCGLRVFAAAMSFDLSDRDRMTRRSDCAFWLHLLAAPLIVHSLISLIDPNLCADQQRCRVHRLF